MKFRGILAVLLFLSLLAQTAFLTYREWYTQWYALNSPLTAMVMLDDQLYTWHDCVENLSEPPEIAGYIQGRSADTYHAPTENGTGNYEQLVGQPYGYVDDQLFIYYRDAWCIFHTFDDCPRDGSLHIIID